MKIEKTEMKYIRRKIGRLTMSFEENHCSKDVLTKVKCFNRKSAKTTICVEFKYNI